MNQENIDPKTIDYYKIINVKEMIKKEFPKLYRFTPNFLIRIFERIIHQKELQKILEASKYKFEKDWIDGILKGFRVDYRTIGEENAAKQGRFIFVSNHPLGGLDGMSTLSVIGKYHNKFHSLSNELVTIMPNLRSFVIPVNQRGKQSREFVKKTNEAMAGNAAIITYPATIVSQKIKGEITDLPWDKSFVRHAVQFERDIVPVYFEAKLSTFYYRFAQFIRFFGLDINITLLFLLDETFKQSGNTFNITFGEPISYKTFSNSQTQHFWAQRVREHVIKLKENPKAIFHFHNN